MAVVLPFLHYGSPSGHDFEFHVNSWLEVLAQWKQGIVYPRWAPPAHYGYGEARFLFYPPASWILGAALGAVLPWVVVPAAYVVVVLTLCGTSMFVLARAFLARRDAIFAAVLYTANPYFILIVYWRSAYAELLAGALLPLLLLAVFNLDKPGMRPTLLLSLIVAGVWLTNAPSAVMLNYSLVLLVLCVAVLRRSKRVLLAGAVAAVVGLCLAAFYVLPAVYEQKWVNIEQVVSPGLRPSDNFLFTTVQDVEHTIFNRLASVIGLSEILLAIAAGVYVCVRKKLQRDVLRLVALWGGAATLLMCSFTSFFWTHLPQLRFIQLPWRWLLCLSVAFALLLALCCTRWWSRIAFYLVVLGVIAYGWHRIQTPWWETRLDIKEMVDDQLDGRGNEGTDEYVPTDADPYEIKHTGSRAWYEGTGQAQISTPQWLAESRQISAHATASGNVVVRLFNYPAWQAEVNGHVVPTSTRPVTGEMVIPVQAGANHIQLKFVRTWDRTAGGFISLASGVLVGGLLLRKK